MKNLFKNLMLVAVAAMAFTACQNDNNEVNEVNRVTRYEFTANIADDTRSGFVEKEEGATAYKSEWHEGDEVKVFVDGYNDPVPADIDTDGNFGFELENAPESFYMTVCSPAESWSSKDYSTIPAEQTPLANSVDPKAHLLRAQNVLVSNGTADAIVMDHQAAYGKMTVNTPADFEISKVELSLVGLPNSAWADNQTYSYTINANEVEGNVFWFATEAMQIVKEFTVTAYNAEDQAYSKTVTGLTEGQLGFTAGRVSTFSVSKLEAPAEPEVPAKVFTSAEVSTAYDLNDYEICFKDQEGKEFYVEFYYENGTYVIDNDILKEGTYVLDEFNGDNGLYYVNYDDIGFSCATVIVSHVEGLYNIQFTNLKKWDKLNGAWTDVPFEEAVYTGGIIGLSNPDGSAPTPEPDPTPDPEEPEEPFADVMATDIKWDSSNSCFSLTAPGFSYIYLEVNSANRPDNKSILVGDYTYGKNENQFRIKYNNGTVWNYSDSSGTMNVDVVDGQYIIIINVTSGWGSAFKGSIGYKGLPDGWDEPVADTTPVIKVDQSSVELKRAGSSVDVNVTLKNITDSIVAESNNAQFTTSVNGNVVTISAGENNTGADIDGIVTISAGGVSAQVTVKQVAVDAVLEVKWSYVTNSSSSGTFGHVWNVSGKDLDGYDISAQITMDSRNGYTSSSHFTAGTYNYHGYYADGNYGDGMWFTMRNIEFRGSSYSNTDVTGTITVEVVGGRTKVTADIYNLVNGYTTTKITTFVGYLN